jgi:hypothetical protein
VFRVGGCGLLGGGGWGRAYVVDAGSLWTLARTIPEFDSGVCRGKSECCGEPGCSASMVVVGSAVVVGGDQPFVVYA